MLPRSAAAQSGRARLGQADGALACQPQLLHGPGEIVQRHARVAVAVEELECGPLLGQAGLLRRRARARPDAALPARGPGARCEARACWVRAGAPPVDDAQCRCLLLKQCPEQACMGAVRAFAETQRLQCRPGIQAYQDATP